MRKYYCNERRMRDKIKTFSKYGHTAKGGITRYSLSNEAILAREEFIKRMKGIGAKIQFDDMANIYATIEGTDKNAKRIVMASHLDSVKNGGNYDGILGVIGAMEVLETIVSEGIKHKHPITAMVWTNEEGSLYPPAMMSSGVLCGKFDKEKMLNSKSIVDGKTTFGEAIQKSGYIGDEKNRLNSNDYKCMLEFHIEQGPILEANKKEVGVVTCVLGMVNYRIKTYGQADHAGTTPMKFRKDALYAGAEVLIYIHNELDKLDKDLVYTTGEIKCHPCVHTVIPDFVSFSLDVRHENPEVIKEVVNVINNIPKEVCKCRVECELAWERDTVYFDEELVKLIKESADELNIENQYINSGAGHDAQYVASILPTAMIFVPSKDGHSHCEEEFTSVEECTAGASVMLNTVLKVDER